MQPNFSLCEEIQVLEERITDFISSNNTTVIFFSPINPSRTIHMYTLHSSALVSFKFYIPSFYMELFWLRFNKF